MIPWLIVYGLNIIGYFAASIVIFYLGVGSTKACGVVPLIYACTLVVGHFSVVYFVLEQVGSLEHIFLLFPYMAMSLTHGGTKW